MKLTYFVEKQICVLCLKTIQTEEIKLEIQVCLSFMWFCICARLRPIQIKSLLIQFPAA